MAIACVGLVNLVAACVAHIPRLSPLKAVTGIPGAAARGLLAVGVGGVALPLAHLAMRFARCAHVFRACLQMPDKSAERSFLPDIGVYRCPGGAALVSLETH